eukprot:TRINITY_DN734_c0_g1_i10.p1 TRINITY_DN734_c0_g1~~TRINITY_DN734_c0_g1_i10.p1  ORF type:complete len:582 (+),score=132.42 TRINITY_DN734_c0_g1_i10:101-1846(+)
MTTPLKKVPIHLQSAANRLLIKNGSIINADGISQEDIYIEEGMIKLIGSHLIIPGGTRTIDATGKLVLPGGIDMRVHLQSPRGSTQTIDDFYRGSKAAIRDGTTTIVDCVLPSEDETLLESLEKWKSWASERSCCDYALKVQLDSLSEERKAQMGALVREHGVNSFFLRLRDDKVPLGDALETCKGLGAVLQVQCESPEIIAFNDRKVKDKDISGPEGLPLVYSETSEIEGVNRAASLACQLHCPLYLANVMSPKAVQLLADKKRKGGVLFGETLVSAIGSDGSVYRDQSWRKAAASVCSPPLRPGASKDLCHALIEGSLDVLASQHASFNYKQKALGKDDFREIPEGVNGIESRLSILWDKTVASGSLSPSQFVSAVSTTPAKLLNLFPTKGCIAVGSDADVIIWDSQKKQTISASSHVLKTDINIFEGMETVGGAELVICCGRIMLEDDNLKVMTGYGKFLPCSPFPPLVYDALKSSLEGEEGEWAPVQRSEEDLRALPPVISNGDLIEEDEEEDNDIPGPPTPHETQPSPAPSQHESTLNLNSHPNNPDSSVGQANTNRVPMVRVRAPPGGNSCGGFW